MFLHLSVILFTGGVSASAPPLVRHPHGQTPPPWQTSPWQTHPCQVHAGIHPSLCSTCWDTVNKRAVRILLECILVGHTSYGDVDLFTSTSLGNLHV